MHEGKTVAIHAIPQWSAQLKGTFFIVAVFPQDAVLAGRHLKPCVVLLCNCPHLTAEEHQYGLCICVIGEGNPQGRTR